MLKKFVLENRKRTTKDLTVMLSNDEAQISSRTVRRRLSKFGFKSCRLLEKPKLTPAMRKNIWHGLTSINHETTDGWTEVRQLVRLTLAASAWLAGAG
jgi:hypothetical protein